MPRKTYTAGHGRGGRRSKRSAKKNSDGTTPRGRSKMQESLKRYPLSGDFSMELSGDWRRGGFLDFVIDGDEVERIDLAAAPWSLMADLFLAAIHADHFSAAFVPTARLVKRLGEHDAVANPTKQKVYKLVREIRVKLAATMVRKFTGDAHLSGKVWAEQLLSNQHLGYRIGVPPKYLKLTIGEPNFGDDPSRRDPEDKGEEESSSGGLLQHDPPADDSGMVTRRKPK